MPLPSGLSCGVATIKYLLFIFNLLFVACGIALITIAAIPLATQTVGDDTSNSSLIFLIVVGAFIFLVAFFGCCGALRESRWMLISFAVILLVLVVLQIASVTLAFISGTGINIDKKLQNLFITAGNNDTNAQTTIDSLQQSFQCCGYNGPSQYGNKPPASCCVAGQLSGSSCFKPYEQGCKAALKSFLKKFATISGAIGIVIVVVELIGVVFSLLLSRSLKDLDQEGFSPVPTNNPVQAPLQPQPQQQTSPASQSVEV